MRDFLPDPKPGSSDYTSGSEDEDIADMDDIVNDFIQLPVSAQPHSADITNNDTLESEPPADTTEDTQDEERGNWQLSDSEDEETAATVEEVFEIEPAIEATREQPPDIEVGAEVIDVKFHPTTNLIAAATLDAEVVCYRYTTEKTEELHSSEHHDSALRSILFSKDGNHLLTASKDHTVAVLDSATWAVKKHYLRAHNASVYSLCAINDNVFASGDDEGTMKVWDMRREKPIFEFKCGEETVNAIIVDDAEKTLVAAVNDGSIAAFNLSRRKLIVQSEMYDYPLTCMAVVRNGTRLAVGSDNGNLHLFKWGEFAYHLECMSEQPQQINCMEQVGDNRIITGCEDGYIRALNLYPHRYVGVVGRHLKYGVEAISISCDQRYLASCCQDDTVQFWDLQHLYSQETDERKKGSKSKDMVNNLLSARERNPTEFFADMSQEVASDDDETMAMGTVEKPKNIE